MSVDVDKIRRGVGKFESIPKFPVDECIGWSLWFQSSQALLLCDILEELRAMRKDHASAKISPEAKSTTSRLNRYYGLDGACLTCKSFGDHAADCWVPTAQVSWGKASHD